MASYSSFKEYKLYYNSEETIEAIQASAMARTFDLSNGLLKRMRMDWSVHGVHVHCMNVYSVHERQGYIVYLPLLHDTQDIECKYWSSACAVIDAC